MPNQEPYLSIVATARNDNHGGNLLQRMQLFINGIFEQFNRYSINAELILVEWNPPSDRPKLINALDWSLAGHSCSARIIEVPSSIHQKFKYSDVLPLFQMIAKNVGIRRAKGQFILATNIDILFSDEWMRYLLKRRLKNHRMYRADRYDVDSNVPLKATCSERLEYCEKNIIRINRREGTLNLRTGHYNQLYPKVTWLRWLKEKMKDWGIMKDLAIEKIARRSRLHTNACGDFTLMSHDAWSNLRGYAELEIFSLHLDSLLCYAAHHNGFREKILKDPIRIYHVEHMAGSGWTLEGQELLMKRLNEKAIPCFSHEKLDELAIQMRKMKKAIIFNEPSWGLAEDDFLETVL